MKGVEEFARLRAEIEAGAGRDAVLERAGLTVPQWIALQRQWLRALAREALRGERRLGDRYRHAFIEHVAPPPSDGPPPVLSAAPVASASPGLHAMSPWAPSAPATLITSLEPAGEALPFVARASAPPPPAADAVRSEAAGLSGETAAVAALSDEEIAASLPAESVDMTALGALIDPAALEPLPFRSDGAPSSAPALAGDSVAAEAGDMLGATTFVAALSDAEVLPFAALPDLPLARYASLVAELHGHPAQRAAILHRYGLDGASFSALETKWSQRMGADPREYGEFRRCYDLYAAWLKGRSP
jgi:hypothetical protein